MTAGTLEPSRE